MEKLGIRPERLQLEWISAAEGQKFARVMRELEDLLTRVTPEEVAESREILMAEIKASKPIQTTSQRLASQTPPPRA
jgi:hypothetical protein